MHLSLVILTNVTKSVIKQACTISACLFKCTLSLSLLVCNCAALEPSLQFLSALCRFVQHITSVGGNLSRETVQRLFEACALDLSNLYVSNLTVTSTLSSQALAHNCECDRANVGLISAATVLYIALLTDRESLSETLRNALGPRSQAS